MNGRKSEKNTRVWFHGNQKVSGMEVEVDLTSQRSQDGIGQRKSHRVSKWGCTGPLRVIHSRYHLTFV